MWLTVNVGQFDMGNRPSCCIRMFKFIYIYILQFVILFFITFNIFEAHELRAWLLHYSPVVLYGILPDDYYQHHLLLVESIYLLLQEAIPDKEIDHVVKLLLKPLLFYVWCTVW